MLVYILFHETNTGHSDDSDGYVEAVYATEEAAEAAKLAHLRALVADGADVFRDPDDPDAEELIEWTDDFRVLAFEVKS